AGAIAGATWLTFGAWLALKNRVGVAASASALGVGLAVTAGWVLTYALSQQAFTPIAVKSVSFTGPSADTLMALINSPMLPLGFDLALVPGVFAGSMLAALVAREFMLEGFRDGASMTRYISGAVLMGFGGMLAGGCAVGAGVPGGARRDVGRRGTHADPRRSAVRSLAPSTSGIGIRQASNYFRCSPSEPNVVR